MVLLLGYGGLRLFFGHLPVQHLHKAGMVNFGPSGRGLLIVEVPITFTERERGRSKISRQEIFRAIGTVFRLAGRRR